MQFEEASPANAEGQAPAAPGPLPKKGRIVHYRLAHYDVASIDERRAKGLFAGNPVREGQTFPMLITEDWGGHHPGQAVNGQVFLDGNDTFWATSRMAGEGPGTWSWPER